jgi:hypothetical protein
MLVVVAVVLVADSALPFPDWCDTEQAAPSPCFNMCGKQAPFAAGCMGEEGVILENEK